MHEEARATPSTDRPPARDSRGWLRQPRVRLGAIVALAAAAGVIAWAVIGSNDDSSSSETTTNATQGPVAGGIKPVGVSASGLGTLAATVKEPIYWDGPKSGYLYELTRLTDGKVYVRYLPPGVEVGDKRADFLIVATYPFPGAYESLKRVAKGKELQIEGGGIALVHATYPKSVHLAFPDVDYQIEVYDPSPERALEVATSGEIRPVR